MKKLILGSSSPARAGVLKRIGIPFEQCSPDIDETALPGEAVEALVQRLAQEKAEAVVSQVTRDCNAIVVTSDQVALIDGCIMGKPLTHERAVQQLQAVSSKAIVFYTSLCVMDVKSQAYEIRMDTTTVCFKALSNETIETYLQREKPYQCAGSFRSEGLGIVLVDSYESKDPNSLIGLPVIEMVGCLEKLGCSIFDF